jgi:hypothetical protein
MCSNLHSKDSHDDDDVDNRMEAYLEDELETYNFDDGRERSRRKGSCGSLEEGVHEGGNNKSNEEGNVRGNTFQGKDKWQW